MNRFATLIFAALLLTVSTSVADTTKPPDGNPPPCCGYYCDGHMCCVRQYCGLVKPDTRKHIFEQNERMGAVYMRQEKGQ